MLLLLVCVVDYKMGEKKKSATILIRLVSAAGTGFFYVKKKNPKKIQTKLEFRKYDPRVNRHVLFTEAKMKWLRKSFMTSFWLLGVFAINNNNYAMYVFLYFLQHSYFNILIVAIAIDILRIWIWQVIIFLFWDL